MDGSTHRLECPHEGEGKRFYNGVLCCADCRGDKHESGGAAVAGTPRRIQHDIPRPDMVKESAPVETAAVRLRAWLDKQRYAPGGDVSPEVRREFERAIEDIRAGG